MKGKGRDSGDSRTVENRRARFDYAIGETVECGMVLYGPEVKSVRDGQVSLQEGYVAARLVGGKPRELWLHGVNIAEYGPAAGSPLSPTRTRKLLANAREIERLWKAAQVKGNTLVPLKLYFKNGFAKCLVGVGTGRKRGDKRAAIAEREVRRDIDRAMSKRDR
ncbi:MAG: SsrA-binding protein [Planctomyces sp.]|nr:SsrA-binding protein [Planctomyces sp.]MBA4120042.1 SsrA-binding protein [Isosphaera sp.]